MGKLEDIFTTDDIEALKKLKLDRHEATTLSRLCFEYANIKILRYLERKGVRISINMWTVGFDKLIDGLYGNGKVSVDVYKNFIRYFFTYQYPTIDHNYTIMNKVRNTCKQAYKYFLD